MKKTITLITLLVTCWLLNAKEIDLSTARTVGYNYLSQRGWQSEYPSDSLKLVYSEASGSQNAFYVFGSGHSFVIVAAEDNVVPVLGYSLDNSFRANGMPVHIKNFLDEYKQQIVYVQANKVAANDDIKNQWNKYINNIVATGSGSKTTAVSALLSTTWDQSPYYNDNCPYDYSAGARSVTGCVATATAQVMKYHGWPSTGVGFHSYRTSSFGTLSANFSAHTYNWSAMPSALTSSNASVAQLMSDVGISVDMNYSAASSSAYVISSASASTNCAEYALKTYFDYDPSLHGYSRSGYSDATWVGMLKTDLNASRPIIYAGFGSGGGHCFVLDGYDASDNFHVNWGWGGYCNGYFDINALNPSGTGTGGGSGGYNSGHQAILGVKPNSSSGTSVVDTLALYSTVSLSSSTINYGAAFTVSTVVGNFGSFSFSGDLCAAAFDASGNFICFVDSIMSSRLGAIPSGYSTGTITFSTSGLLALLPGSYTIGIFYRRPGDGWSAVWDYGSTYVNFVTLNVVNHNPIEITAAITPSPTNFVQGSAGSVTLNIGNYSSTSYSGSLDVSLYNLDGSFNSSIQTMSGISLASGRTFSSVLTFSTSSITAAPGTYLLAAQYSSGSSWYLCGADYYSNPIYVTVVAPPPSPDIYEVNNASSTAYTLPLTFTGSTGVTSTPGSNFHTTTDLDFYKVNLSAGYSYTFDVRVNDELSADDAGTYTTDAVWSYSTDGGSTWSTVYTDIIPGGGRFTVSGGTTGATVIFKVSQALAGNIGSYMLKVRSVTRSPLTLDEVGTKAIEVYPVPASDYVTVDLSEAQIVASKLSMVDAQGKLVYDASLSGLKSIKIPVHTLANGVYTINISTEAGIITRQITVAK